MASDDLVDVEGKVVSIHKGDLFKVEADGLTVLAKPSGKLRQNKIKIVVGDRVLVQVSPADLSVGRIVSRL
jgi:translation initiation factor IF-1